MIWYDIWYDMIWYDMICDDLICYDTIWYLFTAIRFSAGGGGQ